MRSLVSWRRINLAEPFKGVFRCHLLFCRNVMIYFDAEAKAALVRRLYHVVADGGYLYLGSAETIDRERKYFTYPLRYSRATGGPAVNADVIRVFILERSPRMMIKLLSFFESKLDVEVVEANQNVDAFLDEARRFEMKGLMDKLRPEVIVVDLCEPVKNDLVILAKIKEMAFVPVIAFSTLELPRRDVSEMGFYSLVRRPSLDDEQDERTAFNKQHLVF